MKYEYVVDSPCPNCQAPVVSLGCYCCSTTADRWCMACNRLDSIPNKEAHRLLDTCMYATNLMGTAQVFLKRPATPFELDKQASDFAKYKTEHPEKSDLDHEFMKHLYMNAYIYVTLTNEEKNAFILKVKSCGKTSLASDQIGFVGNRQVFEPTMKSSPEVQL